MTAKNIDITRKEFDIIAEERGIWNQIIIKLLNALSRYDSKCKVYSIRRKLQRLTLEKIAKTQNMSKNDFNKIKKIQEKSIDELKAIARLWRINNFEKLRKEDLILKSESDALKKNNNNNNNSDKKSYIRMVLRRIGNTITNKGRNIIKKELYEIEKIKIF